MRTVNIIKVLNIRIVFYDVEFDARFIGKSRLRVRWNIAGRKNIARRSLGHGIVGSCGPRVASAGCVALLVLVSDLLGRKKAQGIVVYVPQKPSDLCICICHDERCDCEPVRSHGGRQFGSRPQAFFGGWPFVAQPKRHSYGLTWSQCSPPQHYGMGPV